MMHLFTYHNSMSNWALRKDVNSPLFPMEWYHQWRVKWIFTITGSFHS